VLDLCTPDMMMLKLPDEALQLILSDFSAIELCVISCVSKKAKTSVWDDSLWKKLFDVQAWDRPGVSWPLHFEDWWRVRKEDAASCEICSSLTPFGAANTGTCNCGYIQDYVDANGLTVSDSVMSSTARFQYHIENWAEVAIPRVAIVLTVQICCLTLFLL